MARFTVEGGEGSSQRLKRPRNTNTTTNNNNEEANPRKLVVCTETSSSASDDSSSSEEEEEEEEEGVESNSNVAVMLASLPRSSNSASGPPRTSNAICVTLSDPEVLDCPICYDFLSIPVFQCENGHTACSSCCKKVSNKCPSCSMPIGYNRCRAIEKVLESVKLPCQNLKYGCREMVCLSKKAEHDKVCNNAPCSCFFLDCNFVGSARQLYQHFSNKHKGSATRFLYDVTFPVLLFLNRKTTFFQEKTDGVLFVLKNNADAAGSGNVITLSCIGPPPSKDGYAYQLDVGKESSLRFQSFTTTIQKVNDDDPNPDSFLVIPRSFFGSYEQICLDICIWRPGSYPMGISRRTNPQRSAADTNSQRIA